MAVCIYGLAVHAQVPPRPAQVNGDCSGAIFIRDSVFVQESAVRGFGNLLEVRENPPEDKQWLEREHHSTWYKFRAPVKTTLTFDIIPKNPEDDIDFLLFQGAIPGFCEKVPLRQVEPVRTNISRNDRSLGSRCGLRKEAPDHFVRSGIGSSYSRAIDVQQGELLYLLVDYQDRPLDGYTIRFHYDPPPPPPEPEPKAAAKKQVLDVRIADARSGAPLNATLTVEGMYFDSLVEVGGKSGYRFEMEPYRNIKLGCVRQGYMFRNVRVKGSQEDTLRVEVKLEPITPGQNVVLEEIRFVGNDTKVLRSSEAGLLLLLRFLQANPDVRIMVEGHVNGPTFKNSKEFVQLSQSRAMTVYNFLLVNDVDPGRIGYVGLGNSRMIYPEPKNQEESEANRRVEIKVLGN
jgi:outer membrane protein OmpA-like peptidoglycan-associated protein